MRAFCLTCELSVDVAELVMASWYGVPILGCEEESLAGDKVRLKCYFKDSVSLHTAEFKLMDISPSLPLSISVIADQDWNAAWKKNMRPVEVTPGVWISPAWLPPPNGHRDHWIKIEPKMAFGTGHHETTRLACQGIMAAAPMLPKQWKLLDIGTGSGVLCFVADFAGCGNAFGLDTDAVCLSNLSENKRKNKAHAKISFSIGSLDIIRTQSFFDCVVMNMISADSEPLLPRLREIIRQNGVLIWSGLLLDEHKTIINSTLAHGFHLHGQAHENEWWCGTFIRR